MLAGRTIMAMLAVLLQMLAAGNSQATPDSGAILRSARRAQAAFESTRTRSLPERPGGWSHAPWRRMDRGSARALPPGRQPTRLRGPSRRTVPRRPVVVRGIGGLGAARDG